MALAEIGNTQGGDGDDNTEGADSDKWFMVRVSCAVVAHGDGISCQLLSC